MGDLVHEEDLIKVIPPHLYIPFHELSNISTLSDGCYYSGNYKNLKVRIYCKPVTQKPTGMPLRVSLEHQNLWKLYGVAATKAPSFYYVLEDSHLCTLLSELQTRSFNLVEQVSICLQASRAINYLHTRSPPILHRCISSSNFFIEHRAKLLLQDFSDAWPEPDCRDIEVDKWYAAPEVLTKPQKWSLAADVYSLGRLFFEIVSGYTPHASYWSRYQFSQQYDSPIPTNCPKTFADLIKKCLDLDPSKRPTTAELISFFEAEQLAALNAQQSNHHSRTLPKSPSNQRLLQAIEQLKLSMHTIDYLPGLRSKLIFSAANPERQGIEKMACGSGITFAEGYQPPLTCCEHMLQDIASLEITNLPAIVAESLRIAELRVTQQPPNTTPLALDKAVAIAAFSDSAISTAINAALKARNADTLAKLKPFLYYLMTGVTELPPITATVYHSAPLDQLESVLLYYRPGTNIHWSAFTKTKLDSKAFPEDIIFRISTFSGRDITPYSVLPPPDKEVLLSPNSCFVVVKEVHMEAGIYLVDMIEHRHEHHVC